MVTLATGGVNGGGWIPEPPHILGIYAAMLVSHGLLNTFSIRVLSVLDGISAVWHVVGTLAFMIILLAVAPSRQPASWVFGYFDPAPDSGIDSPVYIFMLGLLMSMFTLTGEEVRSKQPGRGCSTSAEQAICDMHA
jgi:amino acid transporter